MRVGKTSVGRSWPNIRISTPFHTLLYVATWRNGCDANQTLDRRWLPELMQAQLARDRFFQHENNNHGHN